jgi:hypothetical protein
MGFLMNNFKDLAPTESDAAGIVGGAAFLDLGPIVAAVVGIVAALTLHID